MHKGLQSVITAVDADVPVLVIGEPGVGKTAMIETTLPEMRGMHVETVIVSIRDITDISGLPVVREDGISMAPPSFIRRVKEAHARTGKPVVIFWDELSTAPPTCQAGVLRVINEKWCGDEHIPYVRHVAAMNPPHTSAGGGELTAPLANRLLHVNWSVDVAGWLDWALPRSAHHMTVAGFIRGKAQALLQVPKEESKLGTAWPSPRTWDMAAKLQGANQFGTDAEIALVAGCVGEGMAIEYLNWRNALDLPDPEDLLKNPAAFKVPERGDVTFTVLASVANAVVEKMTKERYLAAWKIFEKAALANKQDVATAVVSRLVRGAMGKEFMGQKDVRDALRTVIAPFTALLTAAGIMPVAK